MSDKYNELLEQYDLKILSTFRSRGTFQCETDRGLALLKEYPHSLGRLAMEYEWKEKLADAGFARTDRYFLNRGNSLISYDRYHTPFVLKMYYHGRECDCCSRQDVRCACKNLALLHQTSEAIPEIPFENPSAEPLASVFRRRNRELLAIRRFISRQKKKRGFELLYLECFRTFYAEASAAFTALEQFAPSFSQPSCGVCHGAYHHHNILILPDQSVATVNFESICWQPYLMDLYLFLRKTLEKNHYDYGVFETAISSYASLRPLAADEYRFLYLLFLYPEKFRKISNHYYNRRKSWISPRLEGKLRKVLAQNARRQEFLRQFRAQL